MRLVLAVLAAAPRLYRRPRTPLGLSSGSRTTASCSPGGPEADKAVLEWQQNGIQTVRIYALWSRIAPSSPGGEYTGARSTRPWTAWSAPGMKPILTITGPGPLWVSRRSERGEPRYDPDPKLFGEFARHGRRALRRPRGPLHRLERAEPRRLAAPAGRVLRQGLQLGRAAPVPRPRRRRLPGDPRRRQHRPGPDRRDVQPRQQAHDRELQPPPAGLPARARVRGRQRSRSSRRGAARASRRRAGRRLRVPPARRARRAREGLPASRRRLDRLALTPHEHARQAAATPADQGHHEQARASTWTSSATRPTRRTSSPGSRSASRTSGCSAPPTRRGATRA